MVITLVNDNVRGRLGIYSVVERWESISIRTASRTSGDAHVAALEAVYSTVPITMEGLLTLISAKKSRMRFMSWYSAKDTCATCFVRTCTIATAHARSVSGQKTHPYREPFRSSDASAHTNSWRIGPINTFGSNFRQGQGSIRKPHRHLLHVTKIWIELPSLRLQRGIGKFRSCRG
jgi:hypothetical protein